MHVHARKCSYVSVAFVCAREHAHACVCTCTCKWACACVRYWVSACAAALHFWLHVQAPRLLCALPTLTQVCLSVRVALGGWLHTRVRRLALWIAYARASVCECLRCISACVCECACLLVGSHMRTQACLSVRVAFLNECARAQPCWWACACARKCVCVAFLVAYARAQACFWACACAGKRV
jgi:hypothetical protein